MQSFPAERPSYPEPNKLLYMCCGYCPCPGALGRAATLFCKHGNYQNSKPSAVPKKCFQLNSRFENVVPYVSNAVWLLQRGAGVDEVETKYFHFFIFTVFINSSQAP